MYRNQNRSYNSNSYYKQQTQRKPEFIEDREAAFFLGKLNKHHDREQVYNQLKRLTKIHNFYIKRFDMPNGPNGRGNKGFAFVHCRNREQARQIISMKFLRLGNQDCEVKPYGGRTSSETNCSDGRGTPDSGCVPVSAKFENPLKHQEENNLIISENSEVRSNLIISENSEVRSRMNSGIQVSESGRFSDKISTRNVSESESNNDEMKLSQQHQQQKPAAAPSQEYNEISEINYDQTSPVRTLNADAELRDYWLEEQTKLVSTLCGENESFLESFKFHCDVFMEYLMKSDPTTIQEVQNILYSQQTTIGCI